MARQQVRFYRPTLTANAMEQFEADRVNAEKAGWRVSKTRIEGHMLEVTYRTGRSKALYLSAALVVAIVAFIGLRTLASGPSGPSASEFRLRVGDLHDAATNLFTAQQIYTTNTWDGKAQPPLANARWAYTEAYRQVLYLTWEGALPSSVEQCWQDLERWATPAKVWMNAVTGDGETTPRETLAEVFDACSAV